MRRPGGRDAGGRGGREVGRQEGGEGMGAGLVYTCEPPNWQR